MATHRFPILYLDMNSYFASVEQQEDPSLRGQPLGVLTVMKPSAAIIAASIEAKAMGMKFGMRASEAKALIPQMQFRPARHNLYVDYHHRILEAAGKILPIDKVHSIDEFSCRLMGSEQELPRALDLARAMRAQIYLELGSWMRCSIGLGSSLLLAKLAGELQKPEGLEWLCPEVLPQKIKHLKLTDIAGISHGINARLERAGVTKIEELYALDPKHARKIWGGVQGERFVRALHGEDILPPSTRTRSMGHSQVLSYQNRTPENARLVSRRLLIKAATRIRRRNMFATYMHISVRCAQRGKIYSGQKFHATQDSFFLLAVFQSIWQELQIQKPTKVGITLAGLISPSDHIADLFENRAGPGVLTDREKLCLLVDGLNQTYGQDTVIYGEAPAYITPYTGAKIAFHRVPGKEEFRD